jgi:hypothetical protein
LPTANNSLVDITNVLFTRRGEPTEAGYLVYVPGLKGPAPQKMAQRVTNGAGLPKPALAVHALKPGELALTLNELFQRYPLPVPPPRHEA